MSDDFMVDAPLSARKKLIYPLAKINRMIPAVDIFDEPTRCYKINKEWARIVIGFASLLAEPELWLDAEDETYIAVQQVMKFLEGSECGMNCEDLQDCLENSPGIININNQLNDLRDYVQYGDTTLVIENTTITDIFDYSDQQATIGGEVPAPDLGEDCNKDAVWGAVNSLVDYINATNIDFLQNVAQATNLAAQAERAISGVPVLGLLPIDELVGLVDWYSNEAYSEYLATVDEALLQQTKCDLFCIATTGGRCGLSYADLINYFSSKVPLSAGQFADTVLNLIQFSLLGSFSGDDYFYYMCYFQLAIAAVGEKWMNQRGTSTYELYAAAGFNSPDNDWEIFCDECSDGYTYIEFDFTLSDFGWVASTGNYDSGIGWRAVDIEPNPSASRMQLSMTKVLDPDLYKMFAMGQRYTRQNGDGSGDSQVAVQWLEDGVPSGGNLTFAPANAVEGRTWTSAIREADTLSILNRIGNTTANNPDAWTTKVRIWLEPDSPVRGKLHNTPPSATPANGSTSEDYWLET